AQQLGGAIGVAIGGTVFFGYLSAGHTFVAAFSRTAPYVIGAFLLCALASLLLPRTAVADEFTAEEAAEPATPAGGVKGAPPTGAAAARGQAVHPTRHNAGCGGHMAAAPGAVMSSPALRGPARGPRVRGRPCGAPGGLARVRHQREVPAGRRRGAAVQRRGGPRGGAGQPGRPPAGHRDPAGPGPR